MLYTGGIIRQIMPKSLYCNQVNRIPQGPSEKTLSNSFRTAGNQSDQAAEHSNFDMDGLPPKNQRQSLSD